MVSTDRSAPFSVALLFASQRKMINMPKILSMTTGFLRQDFCPLTQIRDADQAPLLAD